MSHDSYYFVEIGWRIEFCTWNGHWRNRKPISVEVSEIKTPENAEDRFVFIMDLFLGRYRVILGRRGYLLQRKIKHQAIERQVLLVLHWSLPLLGRHLKHLSSFESENLVSHLLQSMYYDQLVRSNYCASTKCLMES